MRCSQRCEWAVYNYGVKLCYGETPGDWIARSYVCYGMPESDSLELGSNQGYLPSGNFEMGMRY